MTSQQCLVSKLVSRIETLHILQHTLSGKQNVKSKLVNYMVYVNRVQFQS